MQNNISARLSNLPSPLLGLALGITGLGVALEHALPMHNLWFYSGCLIAAPLLILIIAKFALHPDIFSCELRHPVLGSLPVAGSMVIMQISYAILLVYPELAEIFWLAAVFISAAIPALFFFHRLREFKFTDLLPSCFLSLSGLFMCAGVLPHPKYSLIAENCMIFSGLTFVCIFPFVIYRVCALEKPDDKIKPVFAIVAAPFNMLTVSWLNFYQQLPDWAYIPCSIAFSLSLWVYALLPKLLKIPFCPAHASLTFPLAISATAMFKLSEFLPDLSYLKFVAAIETVIATTVISWVFIHFIKYTFMETHPAGDNILYQ